MSEARWLLRTQDLNYTYPNGVRALGGVTLQLAEDEITSVIGPSGCGKSTLVSVISGLHTAGGSISWNDDVLRGLDDSRRRLSLVFQRSTVMPWLNVERNISFGLRYLSLTKGERKRRLDLMLEVGGLKEFSRAYPHELSGGMERRVALLTGVATLPKLLLLDEPFSALDEPTRISLHASLIEIQREFRMSVLLITHDIGEAVSLSDRVLICTNRPARIASDVRVDLGRERNMEKVRADTSYQQCYRECWELLWNQIRQPV